MEAAELRELIQGREGWENADKVQRAFQVRQDVVGKGTEKDLVQYRMRTTLARSARLKHWKLVR